jgi:hypothetical protein
MDRTADTLMAVVSDWIEPRHKSSVIAGRHTGTNARLHTPNCESHDLSLMCVLALIRTRSGAPGGIFYSLQPDGGLHVTWRPTRLRRGADPRTWTSLQSSSAFVASMDWSDTPTLIPGSRQVIQSPPTKGKMLHHFLHGDQALA